MIKKRIAQIAAIVMASILFGMSALAAPSINELESQKNEAKSELNDLQSKLNDIAAKIDQLEKDLIAKGEEIAQTEEDLKIAEETRDKQYEDMKIRIKYIYENGDEDLLEILLDCEDFSEFLNQAEYITDIYDYDRDKLDEYIQTVEDIKDLKAKLEKEQEELQDQEKEFESQQDKLNSLVADKKSDIADLEIQIEKAVKEAERKAAEEAARKASVSASGSNATSGSSQTSYNSSSSDNGSSVAFYSESTSSSSNTSGESTASANNSSAAQTIVNAAYSQLGVPYVWGGASSSGFDCSGLVMYCHAKAGISLPHSSGSIGSGGQSVSNPQPGDIVCYSGHCGIYIGGGQMIHAPHTGEVVKIASVYGSPWYKRYW